MAVLGVCQRTGTGQTGAHEDFRLALQAVLAKLHGHTERPTAADRHPVVKHALKLHFNAGFPVHRLYRNLKTHEYLIRNIFSGNHVIFPAWKIAKNTFGQNYAYTWLRQCAP